jgi:hypothetical protein
MISCEWKKDQHQFTMNITIPANATATIYLPSNSSSIISENGKNMKARTDLHVDGLKKDRTKIRVGSGTYHFTVNNY